MRGDGFDRKIFSFLFYYQYFMIIRPYPILYLLVGKRLKTPTFPYRTARRSPDLRDPGRLFFWYYGEKFGGNPLWIHIWENNED